MKKIFGFITCMQLLGMSSLYSQTTMPYGNLARIKTDSGVYKGELYRTGDSAVSILKRRQHKIFVYPVTEINQIVIKSKAPVLTEIIKSTFFGAMLAEFLITWAYLYDVSHPPRDFTKDYPPYWKSLVYGLPTGAVIGFAGQTIETVFIRIRIPINKSQYLFEQKKSILKKRSALTVL
jgi:hypothetical protein